MQCVGFGNRVSPWSPQLLPRGVRAEASENRAASALLSMGSSVPGATLPSLPFWRARARSQVRSRHSLTYTHMCTRYALRHTHRPTLWAQTRISEDLPLLPDFGAQTDTPGHITYTVKAADMQTHQCTHTHQCTYTQRHSTRTDIHRQAHTCRWSHVQGNTVTCLLRVL